MVGAILLFGSFEAHFNNSSTEWKTLNTVVKIVSLPTWQVVCVYIIKHIETMYNAGWESEWPNNLYLHSALTLVVTVACFEAVGVVWVSASAVVHTNINRR